MSKVILTGVTPSGSGLHVGNYFGAIKPLVALGESGNRVYCFVSDLHALTTVQNRSQLEKNLRSLILDYLACGLQAPQLQQSQVRIQLSGAVLGICSQQLVPMKDNRNRVCATEILLSSPAVRNNIREGKTGQMKTVMQTNAESGMHTMEQSLYGYIRSGHVGIEAAIRYAYEPKELKRLLGLA